MRDLLGTLQASAATTAAAVQVVSEGHGKAYLLVAARGGVEAQLNGDILMFRGLFRG
ncbi:MAG TPA: hypothetical protein VFO40_24585 [Chthoniobacterales bacterium]|nr:hypothetical protein [Chthoniobacterales bacterium]